jgi:TonB family protein
LRFFKTNKYSSAGLISISIHILAVFWGSSWVIHANNETRQKKEIILNVRLEKPQKPKIPPPSINQAKEISVVNSGRYIKTDQLVALPKETVSKNAVNSKPPTKLITKLKLDNSVSQRISPRTPEHIRLTQAEIGVTSKIIITSASKMQSENIPKKFPTVHGMTPEKYSQASGIIMNVTSLHNQSIQAMPINNSQSPSRTSITPIGIKKSNYEKVSENSFSLNPKMIIKKGATSTNSIRSVVSRNNNFSAMKKLNIHPKLPVEVTGINAKGLPATILKTSISDFPYPKAQILLAMTSSPSTNTKNIQPSQRYDLSNPSHLYAILKTNPLSPARVSDPGDIKLPIAVIDLNINSKDSALNKVVPKNYSRNDAMSLNDIPGSTHIQKNTNNIKSSSKPILSSLNQDNVKARYPGNIVQEELTQLRRDFNRKIRDRIAKVMSYPRIAKRRGFEGEPVVSFTIDKNGNLSNYSLVSSSGHQILDNSALETIKKAEPYPKIPDKLERDKIKLKLPLLYSIK